MIDSPFLMQNMGTENILDNSKRLITPVVKLQKQKYSLCMVHIGPTILSESPASYDQGKRENKPAVILSFIGPDLEKQ